jgi:hypothetical protein
MSPDDEAEIYEAMRAARLAARGYADFFGWATNRDLEEQGVVRSLTESLIAEEVLFFSKIKMRGRGNDPPDLEALDKEGRRIAIEVTELVDGEAIRAHKRGNPYEWAEWNQAKFLSQLATLLKAKNERFSKLKDGPYPGGYVVLAFTDEPELSRTTVGNFLSGQVFSGIDHIHKAILLLSYDPSIGRCPFFELVKGR